MSDSTTIDGNIEAQASAARAPDFWHWWTGELRALVPSRVVSWLVGEVAVTDVKVDAAGLSLLKTEAGRSVVAGATVPLASLAGHPVVRDLIASGNGHVRVLLDAGQVLTRTIVLPAATAENLRAVMGFELDRHTPFVATQAYYDVRIISRDPQRETIQILLAVAARAVIDPLLAAVRSAGLAIDGIGIADESMARHGIDLLPAQDKPPRQWGNLLRLNLGLIAAMALLALLAVMLPIWQKREAVIALIPLVDKASADFQQSQRLQEEYTRLANEYNYITGKKHGAHPVLAVLEELTRISPDTTVVQNLDLKSSSKTREVTMIGEAQAASKVIEVLEQSPMFQNASQKSQTRRGSQGTNEWFHVATEVKPRPLPAAIRADAALAPPAAPQPVALPPATATVTVPAPSAAPPATGVAEPAGKAALPAGFGTASPRLETPPVAQPPGAKPAAPFESPVAPPANRKQP